MLIYTAAVVAIHRRTKVPHVQAFAVRASNEATAKKLARRVGAETFPLIQYYGHTFSLVVLPDGWMDSGSELDDIWTQGLSGIDLTV